MCQWGLHPQPRHVPWLGSGSAAFQFAGWRPTNPATQSRAQFSFNSVKTDAVCLHPLPWFYSLCSHWHGFIIIVLLVWIWNHIGEEELQPKILAFILTYIVIFTIVLYFFIWFQLTIWHLFISASRAPFDIYCRAYLPVTDFLNFCLLREF